MLVGAHESIQGGFAKAVSRAADDNCESFQIFTKAPQVWKDPEITDDIISAFNAARAHYAPMPALVHVSYLINPCSEKPDVLERSRKAIVTEGQRCDALGIEYIVFHPGSPGEMGPEVGIELVGETLLAALEATEDVQILIENTAGQGKSVGHAFEQLAGMIAKAQNHPRLGICYDTCHGFAAGHPLKTPEDAAATMQLLESTIGEGRLRAFHLNDSKKEFASKKDRHELIGQGEIGLEAFRWLVNAPQYKNHPAILETPIEKGATYKEEVALLKSLRR